MAYARLLNAIKLSSIRSWSSPMMRKQTALGTLLCSPFSHLARLVAQQSFVQALSCLASQKNSSLFGGTRQFLTVSTRNRHRTLRPGN